MIKRKDERLSEIKQNVKDGVGEVVFNYIASSDELFNKIKMYSTISLRKDCGIGYHRHDGEEEIMLVLEGKAQYNDDGVISEIYPGDVTICEDGHSHSIANINDEELIAVAMVLYK